jgi:predicted transcriptional regulator
MARPRGNRKLARLTVSLDGQVFQHLRALAEAADVSIAWLARRAIEDLIESENQEPGKVQKLPPRRNKK